MRRDEIVRHPTLWSGARCFFVDNFPSVVEWNPFQRLAKIQKHFFSIKNTFWIMIKNICSKAKSFVTCKCLFKAFICMLNAFKCLFKAFECLFKAFKCMLNVFKCLFKAFKCMLNMFKCLFKVFKCLFEAFKLYA